MDITNIIKEEIEDFKWIEDVSIEFPLNYEPSPGDKLICKKGFKQDWDSSKYGTASQDLEYGGGGYVPGKIITVSKLKAKIMVGFARTVNIEKKILFFISPAAIRKATKDVINITKEAPAKEYFGIKIKFNEILIKQAMPVIQIAISPLLVHIMLVNTKNIKGNTRRDKYLITFKIRAINSSFFSAL